MDIKTVIRYTRNNKVLYDVRDSENRSTYYKDDDFFHPLPQEIKDFIETAKHKVDIDPFVGGWLDVYTK